MFMTPKSTACFGRPVLVPGSLKPATSFLYHGCLQTGSCSLVPKLERPEIISYTVYPNILEPLLSIRTPVNSEPCKP